MDPSSDAHADADSPEPESYEDEPAEEDEDDASSSAAANPVGGAATGDDEDDEDDQHNPPSVYTSQRTLQSLSHLRDISDAAVAWQVSSAKPGNGVEQLRDAATDSYWQSDGTTQPHYIQIHFHRRLAVTHVALYLDYQLDESYTPKTVRVETGMTAQDLTCTPQNQCMELNEPAGWVIFPVFGTDPGGSRVRTISRFPIVQVIHLVPPARRTCCAFPFSACTRTAATRTCGGWPSLRNDRR